MSDLDDWLYNALDSVRESYDDLPSVMLISCGHAICVVTQDSPCYTEQSDCNDPSFGLIRGRIDKRVIGCRLWYAPGVKGYFQEPQFNHDDDNRRVEVLLASDNYEAEWIPGEPGDCSLYRSRESGKIIGCFLAVRPSEPAHQNPSSG